MQVFGEIGVQNIEQDVDLSTLVFEFIHSGKVYTNKYGDVQFSESELQEIADNFNNNVAGFEIAVDINHDIEKRAYAWIKPGSLEVNTSTNATGQVSLYGSLYKFTPEGEHYMRTGAFRYFSIEVHYDVKAYIQDKLHTFKNVLMGLALTNFPAIKGLSPTFSDNLISNKTANMNTFKIFLSALADQATVSVQEKTLLTSMITTLSEEEKEEMATEIEAVEAKPETVVSTDAEVQTDEEEKEETTTELSALPRLVTRLSESNRKLSEQVKSLTDERKKMNLSDAKNAVMLSNTNSTGFTKDSEKNVLEFMSTLNDGQISTFKSLIVQVKTVQLGEIGAVADKPADGNSDAKAQTLCESIMKKNPGMQEWQALSQAYNELEA